MCLICLNDEKNLEHLFLLCPLAKVVWFGTDLSIITDKFELINLQKWIQDRLANSKLTQPKALWFYGQFVCTLWSIWIKRNRVVFNNQKPNPMFTTRILCFSEDFSENFVLILTKDLFIVRIINNPHKM